MEPTETTISNWGYHQDAMEWAEEDHQQARETITLNRGSDLDAMVLVGEECLQVQEATEMTTSNQVSDLNSTEPGTRSTTNVHMMDRMAAAEVVNLVMVAQVMVADEKAYGEGEDGYDRSGQSYGRGEPGYGRGGEPGYGRDESYGHGRGRGRGYGDESEFAPGPGRGGYGRGRGGYGEGGYTEEGYGRGRGRGRGNAEYEEDAYGEEAYGSGRPPPQGLSSFLSLLAFSPIICH